MGWERSFEKRVMAIRTKELKYQKLNYTIEVNYFFLYILCLRIENLFLDFVERHLVNFRLDCRIIVT